MIKSNWKYSLFCGAILMTYTAASLFGWQWGSRVTRGPAGAQGLSSYRGGK